MADSPQTEGGTRDVNQGDQQGADPLTNRTAQDTPGEKPETNDAESDAPNAPGKTDEAPKRFEIRSTGETALAGREMGVIAPAHDDGSREAYDKLKANAAENAASSSPKMGAQ